MNSILITYDLHNPDRNYPRISEAIKALGDWCHPVESGWIVKTDLNELEVANHLSNYIDSNDSLFTSELSKAVALLRIQGDCMDWLKSQL